MYMEGGMQQTTNFDEVVSFGAAVQAAILAGKASSQVHDLLRFGRHSFVSAFGDGFRHAHGCS